MRIKFTKTAQREVEDVYGYLAAESPSARLGFEERLSQILRALLDFPESGRATNREGIRVKNTVPYTYLVFYRVRGSEIVVIRVLHGARIPRAMPGRSA